MGLARQLHWQPNAFHLKTWQDVAVYRLIRSSEDLDIAEIGGGTSRILPVLAASNRCTNIERFNGEYGGPSEVVDIPNVRNVRAFVDEHTPEIDDNSLDLIFSISVIEHVPDAGCEDFITDMLRMLRPGGRAIHAIDLYVGDSPQPHAQRRLDIYRNWVQREDVIPTGAITAENAVFRTWMASNPDQTMWGWNKSSPSLAEQRNNTQSVTLIMDLVKK